MKITKSQLRKVIKEEIQNLLKENDDSFWTVELSPGRSIRVPGNEASTAEEAVEWMTLYSLNHPEYEAAYKKQIADGIDIGRKVYHFPSFSEPPKQYNARVTDKFLKDHDDLLGKYLSFDSAFAQKVGGFGGKFGG